MAISENRCCLLVSQKKAEVLQPLTQSTFPVEICVRSKTAPNFDRFLLFLQGKVGTLVKEKISGRFGLEWKAALESADVNLVDATAGVAWLLAEKDNDELQRIQLAAKVSAAIMKNFFLPEMSSIVDLEKKISHEDLSNRIDAVLSPDGLAARAKKCGFPEVDATSCDWCYSPIVQSGGMYDLRPSAQSDENILQYDVILCSLGVRYKSYCSNIARTFIINPTKAQEDNYEFLLLLRAHIITLLRSGVRCCDVYAGAQKFVQKDRPDLVPHMQKTFGFSVGMEFRESPLVLNSANENRIPESCAFNLVVGFSNLPNSDGVYALLVSDTLTISSGQKNVWTQKAPYESGEVCFSIRDVPSPEPVRNTEVLTANRTRRAEQQTHLAAESRRREHQCAMAKTKHEEGLRRYMCTTDSAAPKAMPVVRRFESYKSAAGMPRDAPPRISVDTRAQTLLLPIHGLLVPFHVSVLKNVSKSEEATHVYLRLNLVAPGQIMGRRDDTVFEDPSAVFAKTLHYRSRNAQHMNDIYKQITQLKRESLNAEAERKDKAGIVEQDVLQEIPKSRAPPCIRDVFARPTQDTKRSSGDLEIHSNGIRYTSRTRGEHKIDVLFNNVQHLIFQPCDNELMVILHVHLKNPIMIGKRKTKDVQFYRELQDSNFEETGTRRRRQVAYGDEDEVLQEEDDRKRRNKYNREFKEFAEKIVASTADPSKIDLDTPLRGLSFTGSPFRSNVLLQPTSDCLVQLTDTPFLVITLQEVEWVHFERVNFGLKNFDIVFVFSDFSRPPVHVNSVPMKDLESIKDWLDSNNICFSEGEVNLNWAEIMKTINKDPADFFENGGWSFLEASESGSESEPESDISLPSSASSVSYASESTGEDSVSEEVSGEDWDELEELARNHDRKLKF